MFYVVDIVNIQTLTTSHIVQELYGPGPMKHPLYWSIVGLWREAPVEHQTFTNKLSLSLTAWRGSF